MPTNDLIVGLIECSIVLYLCHIISEILHQFFRQSKITKTIEIYHVIVSSITTSILDHYELVSGGGVRVRHHGGMMSRGEGKGPAHLIN